MPLRALPPRRRRFRQAIRRCQSEIAEWNLPAAWWHRIGMLAAPFDMRKPILFAGGIVVRREKGKPEVLIVTARRRRKRWVLPKGRVQDGERASSAALREVREEAGVTGRVLGLAGTAEYSTREGRLRVEYYLIGYTRPCKGGDEERDTKWCAVEDGIAMLTYASARKVLLDVNGKIMKYARDGSSRES